MCTVSYLPIDKGFILTSNRDESPDRGITEVSTVQFANNEIFFPKDPLAGGSWFAFSNNGDLACLLNGAFEPYDITLHFKKSRGILLLDSFKYDDVSEFISKYQFDETAPCTLLLLRSGIIHELIWDGESIHHSTHNPRIEHFWSSVTLYPDHIRKVRRQLFDEWCELQIDYTSEAIRNFHRFGGRGDSQNDFVMNRNEKVKTLSITSVSLQGSRYTFNHLNLDDETTSFNKVVNTDIAVV